MQQRLNQYSATPVFTVLKGPHTIDESYLFRLGFQKPEELSTATEWVYRYYSPAGDGHGLELRFLRDYGIVSISEFWCPWSGESSGFSPAIVGQFTIHTGDDLHFLFSKNVRLNYMFNIAYRRV